MLDATDNGISSLLVAAGPETALALLPGYAAVRASAVHGVVVVGSVVHGAPNGKDTISDEAIWHELSRILESPVFFQSERLGRFPRLSRYDTGRRSRYVEGVPDWQ